MKIPILLTIGIAHSYYRQNCPDFSFILPTSSTQMLKDGKLAARISDGKLSILLMDSTAQDLFSLAGKTLCIGLKLLNPYFSNFTDLGFDFNLFRPLYKNSGNLNPLAEQPVIAVGRLFSHPIISTTRPLSIRLKNAQGTVVQTDTVTATNNRSSVAYDLTGREPGLYTLEESEVNNTEFFNYYADLELQSQGVFGFIEITISESFYTTPPAFEISFVAQQETMKYYVVANYYDDLELNKLSVFDAGEDGRSSINFTSTAFTADDISPDLLGSDNSKVALFKLQTTVMRQEKARQRIQLKKNGDVLISNLPQPRGDRAKSDLIVQISKPKP